MSDITGQVNSSETRTEGVDSAMGTARIGNDVAEEMKTFVHSHLPSPLREALSGRQELPPEEKIPAISEGEFRRGQITEQFINEAMKIEQEINPMTGYIQVDRGEHGVSVRSGKLTSSYARGEWPDQRAHTLAKQLSEIPDSGIDYEAALKVRRLKEEAGRVNAAYDTVVSDGIETEPIYSEERIARVIKGDNQVGPSAWGFYETSQQLGAMARGSGRKYDIKNGVAMRGVFTGKPDRRGNINLAQNFTEGEYVPFAPAHQEAAKEAIRSLGEKRLHARNKLERRVRVKAAKEVLGRASVKIPKPKKFDPVATAPEATAQEEQGI